MRSQVVIAILFSVLAACDPDPAPPPTTGPTTPTTADALVNCFVDGISNGGEPTAVVQQCNVDAIIEEIDASITRRQGIVNDLHITTDELDNLLLRVCIEGPQELQSFMVENALLARPHLGQLLDLAYDAGRGCPDRPGLRDELTQQIWLKSTRDLPTSDPSAVLRGLTVPPEVMVDLFRDVHDPCDVVGNAAVIGVEQWSDDNPPDWIELAFSTYASALCDMVLD